MQPVWLRIFSGRPFEDTYENAQWWKVQQMQPVWLCLHWSKFFEEPCEKTHWTKVKQMQLVWFCVFSRKQFEDPYENAHWRKVKQCNLASSGSNNLRTHLKRHTVRKVDQSDAFHRIFDILLSILIYLSCFCVTDRLTDQKGARDVITPKMAFNRTTGRSVNL